MPPKVVPNEELEGRDMLLEQRSRRLWLAVEEVLVIPSRQPGCLRLRFALREPRPFPGPFWQARLAEGRVYFQVNDPVIECTNTSPHVPYVGTVVGPVQWEREGPYDIDRLSFDFLPIDDRSARVVGQIITRRRQIIREVHKVVIGFPGSSALAEFRIRAA